MRKIKIKLFSIFSIFFLLSFFSFYRINETKVRSDKLNTEAENKIPSFYKSEIQDYNQINYNENELILNEYEKSEIVQFFAVDCGQIF